MTDTVTEEIQQRRGNIDPTPRHGDPTSLDFAPFGAMIAEPNGKRRYWAVTTLLERQ